MHLHVSYIRLKAFLPELWDLGFELATSPHRYIHCRITLLRHVDAFFASHGYANVASIMRYNRPQRTGTYLDHVYAKLPGGGLATPASGTHCSHEDKLQNKWCSGWIQYDGAAPAAGWGACDAR